MSSASRIPELVLNIFGICLCVSSFANPFGTTITYSGRLVDNGSPANGNYDLRFILRDAANSGNQVGNILTNRSVGVTNGLFDVLLDFGPSVFDGSARWLEIGVRTNGSEGAYTTLSPLQPVTPTPYALFSSNAATAGSVVSGQVVKSLNGLTDFVVFSAGSNVSLTTNGNNLRVSASASAGGGGFQNFQVFETNGTFIVPVGVTRIMVEVWGGGGAGGTGNSSGGGGGGGAGGYGKGIFTVSPSESHSVIVGLGGYYSGGTTSSFGILIEAAGGALGGNGSGSKGGDGGLGGTSSASFSITGGSGGGGGYGTGGYSPGNKYAEHAGGFGGTAGAGGGGGGGGAAGSGASGGRAGSTPGGGGGGGSGEGGTSPGRGGDGRVIVWY